MKKQNQLIIDEDFRDLVPGYIERRRAELETVKEFVSKNDFAYLKRLSHDWHGTGESYGIPFVSRIGEKMNRAANAGDGREILTLVEQLRTYLDTVNIRYE